MKREYKKPAVKYINYTYDEQVVASSEKIDGYGDGYQIRYCTWYSSSFSDPCNSVIASTDTDRCYEFQPWSLRG